MQDKKQSLVPELRFPGFEGEWEETILSDILRERNEQYPENEDYPLMAFVANVGVCPKGDRYDRGALVKDAKSKKYKRTKLGDFIYSSNNLETGSIGQNHFGNACISPVYSIFEINDKYDNFFIGTLLTKKEFISKMVQYRQGVIYGQWKIHETEFLKLTVSVPSLPEQQKIAECLSSVDDLIQAEADQLQALKDHKKGLMQQLFPQEGETAPKLRFPGFEGEWEEKKLGEVCNVVDDKCDIGSLTIVTYISTENMLQDFEGVRVASKLPSSGSFTRFKTGDILFSNIRPYLKKVWQAVFDGAASNDVIVFRALGGYNHLFVSQIIKSDSFIAHSMSGAKGVKMPRGDKKMMLDYLCNIPSLPEQQKIAECLSSLDDLIAAQQRKVEALKEHKKGLMQKLFPAID